MSKSASVFVCQSCGYQSPKWIGQCSECGSWNTMVEETLQANTKYQSSNSNGKQRVPATMVKFADVKKNDTATIRMSTQMEEFDRVLGGGIVFGSVVLIGGEPGIGKSTLLTHLTQNILNYKQKESGQNEQSKRVLYVAGEESPSQIALRLERMQEKTSKVPDWKENLFFVTSTDVDAIVDVIAEARPDLVIIDSIQTLTTSDLSGTSGSIGQLKETTDRLTRCAKEMDIPMFLVGHVTKDGTIAGPKVLEHMVDAVLELSGERTSQYRLLRAVKNRFGATDEVGIFVHTEKGLEEVPNPSALFLAERQQAVPGSALVSLLEGTRPLIIEVQSLVVRSELPIPRRVARGIPLPKLQVLLAVLEKFCTLPLGTCDVFVNIAGGMNTSEPGVDLGVAMAIARSYTNSTKENDTVYIGEVGLLGEIRTVPQLAQREKESARLGYTSIVSAKTHKTLKECVLSLKKSEK